mmetsp:Transcript_74521/g.170914  ORF Transcript_74521/g.170914 Transcript_74521/m.170914 type:complete len:330 (-) Transcript_74521:34-1023(-)
MYEHQRLRAPQSNDAAESEHGLNLARRVHLAAALVTGPYTVLGFYSPVYIIQRYYNITITSQQVKPAAIVLCQVNGCTVLLYAATMCCLSLSSDSKLLMRSSLANAMMFALGMLYGTYLVFTEWGSQDWYWVMILAGAFILLFQISCYQLIAMPPALCEDIPPQRTSTIKWVQNMYFVLACALLPALCFDLFAPSNYLSVFFPGIKQATPEVSEVAFLYSMLKALVLSSYILLLILVSYCEDQDFFRKLSIGNGVGWLVSFLWAVHYVQSAVGGWIWMPNAALNAGCTTLMFYGAVLLRQSKHQQPAFSSNKVEPPVMHYQIVDTIVGY